MEWLNLLDSIEFFKKNNIPVLEYKVISSKKDLDKKTDFPYVLKLSSKILHKTEEKAVFTDIYSYSSLVDAYNHLKNILDKKKIDGKIILQKQVKGLELILGLKKDPQFGKIILFGQGGVYTEIINDSSIKLIPLTKKDIEELIYSTKISKMFSARGINYDVTQLPNLIEKILKIENKIEELDLNPIILAKDGLHIVDIRVKVKR